MAKLEPKATDPPSNSVYSWWRKTPLYLRILAACLLGVLVGIILSETAAVAYFRPIKPAGPPRRGSRRSRPTATAPVRRSAAPLVLVAVVQALMHAQIPRGSALKLVSLLLLNTLVAIFIGLFVANLIRPGKWSSLKHDGASEPPALKADPVAQFLENVPKSLLGPFTDDGKITSVILIALAVGIAFRQLAPDRFQIAAGFVNVAFDALITMLHWIIEVIPLAVFGIVASIVATKGFGAFIGLGAFVISVLLGLASARDLLPLADQIRLLGAAGRCHSRHARCPRDGLFHGQFHRDDAAHLRLPARKGRPPRALSQPRRTGRREFQQRRHSPLSGDGRALRRAAHRHRLSLTDQFLVVLTAIAASVARPAFPRPAW